MKEEAEKKGFKLIHKGMGASCERAGSLGLITVRGALHFSKPDRLLVGSTPPDTKSCHCQDPLVGSTARLEVSFPLTSK